jgi:hypothetical protein
MHTTRQSLFCALALACLSFCKGQSYGAYAPTTASPGSARKLQQSSFSPFDSSSKPYGYGSGLKGRHLLEYGSIPAHNGAEVLNNDASFACHTFSLF